MIEIISNNNIILNDLNKFFPSDISHNIMNLKKKLEFQDSKDFYMKFMKIKIMKLEYYELIHNRGLNLCLTKDKIKMENINSNEITIQNQKYLFNLFYYFLDKRNDKNINISKSILDEILRRNKIIKSMKKYSYKINENNNFENLI